MISNATPRGKSHLARSLRGSDCSGVCFCIFVETWTCQTCVGHVPLHVVSDRNQKLSTNRPRSNLLIMHFDAFCTFCTSMFVFFGFLSRQGMLTLLAITARPLVWKSDHLQPLGPLALKLIIVVTVCRCQMCLVTRRASSSCPNPLTLMWLGDVGSMSTAEELWCMTWYQNVSNIVKQISRII